MKKIIVPLVSVVLIILTFVYLNPITDYFANIINPTITINTIDANIWAKNNSYIFVNKTNNFVPYSYQDLLDIFYSIIDNGWHQLTIYCPKEYTKCIDDVTEISGDSTILTHLNNYVHPFNSFTNIKTVISSSGEVTIKINYLYSEDLINKIDAKVDEIIKSIIKDNMTDYDKIKTVHDYIINHTKYDVERNENGTSNYESHTAYGPLFQGYAICNGYTDLMAIFLTKLGFDNYKIATTADDISYSEAGHVWNAVYYNNNWLHIDLTWDDPITKDGKDYLLHQYFLVTNTELKKADQGKTVVEEHNFDKEYYLEFSKH